jgi:predicted DNA-binding transcriptional regulator YafY
MPSTKNAFRRYQIIDRELQRNDHTSSKKLRDLMQIEMDESVSPETIQKDIAFMKSELELDIRYSRSKEGYYYKDGNTLFKRHVKPRDEHDLRAAAAKLALFSASPLLAPVQKTVEKVMQFLELQKPGEPQKTVLIPDDTPVASGAEFLPELLEAIKRNSVICFRYFSTTHQHEMNLEVSPWLLKEYNGRWYLIGADTLNNKPRLYGLDRISGDIEFSYKRAINPPTDLAGQFANVVGVSGFYLSPETIDVFFQNPQDWYIKTKPIHRSQELVSADEKGATFRYFVVRNWEFEAEVRKQLGQIL